MALLPSLDVSSRSFLVPSRLWSASVRLDASAASRSLSLASSCPHATTCGLLSSATCLDLCADKNVANVPPGTPNSSIGAGLVFLPSLSELESAERIACWDRAASFDAMARKELLGAEASACKPSGARMWGWPGAGVGVLLDHAEYFLERCKQPLMLA